MINLLPILFVIYTPIETPLGIDNYRLPPKSYFDSYKPYLSIDSIVKTSDAWFKNKNELLVYSFHTDFYIEKVLHFDLNNFSDSLLYELPIYFINSINVKNTDILVIKKYFNKFLELAKKLPPSLNVTIKGVKIGNKVTDIIELYGKNFTKTKLHDLILYIWNVPYNKQIEHFGQKLRIFVKDNKIISIIIENEGP